MRHPTARHIVILLLFLIAIPTVGKRDSLLWVGIKEAGTICQQGRRDSTLVMARQLLTIAERQNDDIAQTSLHNMIGTCLYDIGQKEAAIKEFSVCVDIAEANDFLRRATTMKSDFLFQIMLPAYAYLAILCKDTKRKNESLRYAKTGMEWIAKCNNTAIKASTLQPIAEILMDHQEYALIYEPMKQGLKDAMEQNLPDYAMLIITYLINIEYNQFHRTPDEIPWIKAGELLLPHVKTETAKTAFLATTKLTIPQPKSRGLGNDSEKNQSVKSSRLNISRPDSIQPHVKSISYRNKHINIAGIILTITLLCFALYILWQHYQHKKVVKEAELKMEERYIEGLENERNRLAKELHDGVSNQLLAIEMKLEQDGLTPQTMKMISESREQVRRVSHELIPPEFEHATLDEVIKSYAASLNGVRHCEVSFQSTPQNANWTQVTSAEAYEIYRIIQEITSNALKHAKATSVSIGLHLDEDKNITVTVSDNGIGITDRNKDTGIGMQTIGQRASVIGGHIDSFHHPFGTTIRLSIKTTKTAK